MTSPPERPAVSNELLDTLIDAMVFLALRPGDTVDQDSAIGQLEGISYRIRVKWSRAERAFLLARASERSGNEHDARVRELLVNFGEQLDLIPDGE